MYAEQCGLVQDNLVCVYVCVYNVTVSYVPTIHHTLSSLLCKPPPPSHAPSLSQLSGFLRSYLLGEEGDDLGADCVQPLDDLRLRDTEGGRVRYKQVQNSPTKEAHPPRAAHQSSQS